MKFTLKQASKQASNYDIIVMKFTLKQMLMMTCTKKTRQGTRLPKSCLPVHPFNSFYLHGFLWEHRFPIVSNNVNVSESSNCA